MPRRAVPISHRWWFRLILVACFFVPALVAVPYDPVDTAVVIAAVLGHPLATAIPALLPIAKLLLLAAAAVPFFGIAGAGRILVGYYAGILLIIAFLLNLVIWFGFNPGDWWMGVLHMPLVITAIFGLVQSRLDR